jgi:L-asparaginase II
MESYCLDVVVTRGSTVESRHRVHAAVVGPHGALLGRAGDSGIMTVWRSCAKPFQVMPFLADGSFDELGWGDDELALACASHGGEPEHVAIAESMLRAIGLEEGDLACGVHDPLSARGLRLAHESRTLLTRVHNNCSGKHAAMLARAHVAGWETAGYERDTHPVQRAVVETIAEWTGLPADALQLGVDGCALPIVACPLDDMARAFARFAVATARGDEVPARIAHAMTARPFLVGGTDRFDTILIEETHGRVVAKVGAEGVHAAAIPELGIGIALKVEDGAQRAQYPALIRLLQHIGALPESLSARLADQIVKPIRNTRNAVVGSIGPMA